MHVHGQLLILSYLQGRVFRRFCSHEQEVVLQLRGSKATEKLAGENQNLELNPVTDLGE